MVNTEKELENRERLVQMFLIISGFLLAYADDNLKPKLLPIFTPLTFSAPTTSSSTES